MHSFTCSARLIGLYLRLALGTALVVASLTPLAAAEPASPSPAPAKAQGPAIEIRELTQDGGAVEEGAIVKYRFMVANRGAADLEVAQVKPGCGCTVAKWDKLIQPGKEGVIEAEVNTAHLRGAIGKHLTVFTNDPARPQIDLTLTAKVTPLVEVTPGLFAVLTVEDQPVTQEFTLERTGGQPMKILEVMTSQPLVKKVKSVKTEVVPLPGEGRYKLTVTATPRTPLGRTPFMVVVRTDVPKAETLSLTLYVERGIVTEPPSVFWLLPAGQSRAVQAMVAISRQKGSFHVTGATVDDPKLQTKLETTREGQEYHVLLSYAGGWDAGQVQKTLIVTTDDPKQPVIKVPVVAMVLKRQTQGAAAH